MLLLKANDVQKAYAERTILRFEKLEIYEGDRIGLVGLNGAGKTTLLSLLAGECSPDAGKIVRMATITWFKQMDEPDDASAAAQALSRWRVAQQASQAKMSGGEGTRLRLAKALGKAAHLLLLDEPTTNLDAQGVTLLKGELSAVQTFVLVSHDRALLDALCTRIVEVRDAQLFCYEGNYSDYRRVWEHRREREQTEYEQYTQERKKLESAYETKKRTAAKAVRRPKNMSARDAGLRDFLSLRPSDAKQLRAERAARNIQARIEHLEVKDKPRDMPIIRPDFRLTDPPGGRFVFEGRRISFAYGGHKIFECMDFAVTNRSHTALIGPNGSGKSTLLCMIDERHSSIRIAPRARIGYFHQDFSDLHAEQTVLGSAMENAVQKEEVVRSTLAQLLFSQQDLHKRVSVLSGGERVKLALARLIVSEFNVLMLDEPTNFLDAASIESLQEILKAYEGTLLFVSHDRAFADALATDVLSIEKRQIKAHHGNVTSMEKDNRRSGEPYDTAVQAASLRVTELISRLSMPGADKAALEPLYEEALAKLKALKRGAAISSDSME